MPTPTHFFADNNSSLTFLISFLHPKHAMNLAMKNTGEDKRKSGQQSRSRNHRMCTVSGCSKLVQQGGVCCEHGAKTRRSPCSTKGCTNFSQRGGLCRRHGAFRLEACHREGCKRIATKGRFCNVHRASSEEEETIAADEISTMTSMALCNEDEALGFESSMYDMATMPFHTPSADEKAISEVNMNDLDIIFMYLVENDAYICGTCIDSP